MKRLATEEEIRELVGERLKTSSSAEEKSKNSPAIQTTEEVLRIKTPYHLLLILRPEVKLHKWQIEELIRLGGFLDLRTRTDINSLQPYLLNLAAANGSGKDEFIIAPFNLWFALTGARNLIVNTSSSFEQLKYQTEVHIRSLIRSAKRVFGQDICKEREFYYTFSTGSEIKLFATDEAGRAEGYHPRPGGKLAIVVNEAKSVDDEIFDALSRCTGYSYWLNVSSPGKKGGAFYQECIRSVQHPDVPKLGYPYFRRVSAYECPHIPLSHIKRMIETRPKAWVDSSINALFTDESADVVIPYSLIERANNAKLAYIKDDTYCLGGDLAAGGDECCFYLRKGQKLVDSLFFRQKDTTITAEIIHAKFGFLLHENYIAVMDDGGVGRGIIDTLTNKGWAIYRRLNNAPAIEKSAYLNFGAESYFHIRRLLEGNYIHIPLEDKKLVTQLTSRIYEIRENGKFKLEDKKLHRNRTGESPDRADAFVLCYWPLNTGFNTRPERRQEKKSNILSFSQLEELISWTPRQKRKYEYAYRPKIH